MTARLPVPGGDDGTWGDILNSFLETSLTSDGTLKPNIVSTTQLQAGSVTNAQLDIPTQTIIDSVASKYVKPAGGIPGSDLSGSVQSSLNSANSAVQSINSKTGTSITLAASDVNALPNTTKLAGLADTSGAAGASNNQVLSYNGGTNQWVAATVSSSAIGDATTLSKGIIQLAGDLAAGTAAAPEVTSTHLSSALPVNQGGTGSISQNFVDLTTNQTVAGNKTLTGATATNSLTTANLQVTGGSPANGKVLTSDNSGNATWVTPTPGSSTLAGDTDVSIASPGNAQVLTYNSGTSKWQNQAPPTAGNATSLSPGLIQLSGDLSGTATSPTVAKLNGGITLPGIAPSTSGQVLTTTSSGSSATTAWSTPAAGISLDTTSGDIAPLGTQAAGSIGKAADAGHIHAMPRLDQVSNPTAAVSLNSQKITNVANGSAASDVAAFGQIPAAGTTGGTYAAGNDSRITGAIQSGASAGGDLSGTLPNPTVAKVNGITVSGIASTNQVLTASSSSTAGWSNLPSAPVSTVFSRVGAVTAQSGDYSFSQVGAAQGLIPTAVKTGAYNAVAGDFVPVDASSGSVTITLPTAPADKSRVEIKMINTSGSNTVTINTGGSDVFNKSGGSTSATLSLLNQAAMLQYSTGSAIWYVQSDDLPLSQLDTRYLELSGGTLSGAFTMQPVNLTDAATISVNAALGNHFRVTLGGSRTLANPTGATDGQLLTFSITQDGSGGHALAFDTEYHFGTDITSINLSTGANVTDKIGVQYNQAASHFDVIAFVRGF